MGFEVWVYVYDQIANDQGVIVWKPADSTIGMLGDYCFDCSFLLNLSHNTTFCFLCGTYSLFLMLNHIIVLVIYLKIFGQETLAYDSIAYCFSFYWKVSQNCTVSNFQLSYSTVPKLRCKINITWEFSQSLCPLLFQLKK